MFEAINRMVLAGLGALTMTRERAEKLFDEYVQRGEATKVDKEGFVKDVLDTAEKGRKNFEELVAKQVRQALASLDVATREDFQRIEGKLDQLLKRQT